MFDVQERIKALDILGKFLGQYKDESSLPELEKLNKFFLEEYRQLIEQAGMYNNWFTRENVEHALQQWSEALREDQLQQWVGRYPDNYFKADGDKTVAIVMAGNIPLVGFHDFLSVLLSGHKVLAKPSSDDDRLLPFIAQVLVAIDKRFATRITLADGRIQDFDAVIATGSDNSARYFEHYFGKYPNIIRKNRSSVAVLEGSETEEDLKKLGEDVFRYFGLGCRNVSKLYLPEGFEVNRLFKAFFVFKEVIDNKKYGNNYDYNRAIYMLEQQAFLENGFLILRKSEDLHAPVAVLHYEFYSDLGELEKHLNEMEPQLQCVVAEKAELAGSIPMGETQKPRLWDYADKVDSVEFLHQL